MLLCIGMPVGVMLVITCLCPRDGEPASFVRGLLMAMACMFFTVNLTKNYVGYWRPYFYHMCGWDGKECTNTNDEARRSFPSGHSSTSFCAMLFTSLFLLGKVAGLRPKPMIPLPLGHLDLTNLLLLLALVPTCLAFWVAASRVRENDHHPADVVAGAMIGSAWAALWYARYFTPLWDSDPDCSEPMQPESSDVLMTEDPARP
ncbi:unnamed protein product [Effrenium voratum]|nr:unnamed protein product [Effrenium voratum]